MAAPILDGRKAAPAAWRGASLALGVMDGVHRGHQAVLAAAKAQARARGAACGAAVFEPHPRRHFAPDAPPFRLQTPDQRARALAAYGADVIFIIQFDASLAEQSAEDFASNLLSAGLGAAHIVVGENFRFGKGRTGDIAALAAFGARAGFSVEALPPIAADGAPISSTRIRDCLIAGDVRAAAALLGRPFAMEGEIVKGFERGRTLSFPTANMRLGAYQQPRFGVYAVRAHSAGRSFAGVANCGVKPTIAGAHEPLLETHLFDFNGDLYGAMIEVEFVEFLRPEERFSSLDALREQISKDAAKARALLSAAP